MVILRLSLLSIIWIPFNCHPLSIYLNDMVLLGSLVSLHIHNKKKIEHFSRLNYQLRRKKYILLRKARFLIQPKYTCGVSLCNRLVWNILTKRVCVTDLTRIDNLSKSIYGKCYYWYNLAPICSLLSLHLHKKNRMHNPDARTNFFVGIF